MLISDWSSDVCSSVLRDQQRFLRVARRRQRRKIADPAENVGILHHHARGVVVDPVDQRGGIGRGVEAWRRAYEHIAGEFCHRGRDRPVMRRSEEHTSALQSLMRISYAVFCLKTKHTTHI